MALGALGRTARPVILGYGRLRAFGGFFLMGAAAQALADEEAVGGDAQGGVVMKAAPAATFVMVEAKLLFQLKIVSLDAPAGFGGVDQRLNRGVRGQVGQEIAKRSRVALWPLDQQPLNVTQPVALRRAHSQCCKAGGQWCVAALAPLDGRQSCAGNDRAKASTDIG